MQRVSNIVSFCSETLKINGSLPIVRRPAIVYPSTTLTAVLGLVTTSSYNVLFVGTNDGVLKKVTSKKHHLNLLISFFPKCSFC